MRQGLSSAETNNEFFPWGKNSAGNLTGWAGKGRAGSGHNQRTYDDELAQDYKHKENK